jgi:adenylate cyclase
MTAALSRFRELHVIARESIFEFRRKIGSPEHMARRLGARFIVAGSVHRSAEQIRIRVQLIDAATGNRLWVDRFDVNRGVAFAIEDDVIEAMAARIAGRLEVAEVERAHNMRRQNMAAYECLLRGCVHARNLSYAETLRARYWFEKALEHDPNYASALALLAGSRSHESLFVQSAELVDEAMSLARRAVALDPGDSSTHRMLATVYLDGLSCGRGSHAVAARELDMALRLNPHDPNVMVNRALQYTYSGQPAAALRLVEKAERLSLTLQNCYLSNRGFALFELRRYAEAIDALERVTSPAHWDHYYLAACYAKLGRQSEARLQIAKVIDSAPFLTLGSFTRRSWYLHSADLEHLLDGLQKAGLPA